MKAFGILINRQSVPLLYLACTGIGFLLLREYTSIFKTSISTRAISVLLQLSFIFIALPALSKVKHWQCDKKVIFLIGAWLLWTCLATLLGEYPWGGLIRWLEILTCITFSYCVYLLIQNTPQYRNIIIYSLITTLLFIIAVYLIVWFSLDNPTTFKWVLFSPFVNNIRHTGYIAATLLPLGYWLLETKSLNKIVSFLYLIMSWTFIFWLGGRGAFLGVFTVTLIYFYISPKNIPAIIISIIISIALSQLFIVDSSSLNLFHIISFTSENIPETIKQLSPNRIIIYSDSIAYWWENFPLMGGGADSFLYINPSISGISQPHSIIIQLLFSYGLPGLLILIYFFFKLLSIQLKSSRAQQTLFLCFLSASIHSLTDGVFYHAQSLLTLSILLPLCLPQASNYVKKKTNTIIFTVIVIAGFFSIFSLQVYNSKNKNIDHKWVEWNSSYPFFFSPLYWLKHNGSSYDDYLVTTAAYYSSKQCHFYSMHSSPEPTLLSSLCKTKSIK